MSLDLRVWLGDLLPAFAPLVKSNFNAIAAWSSAAQAKTLRIKKGNNRPLLMIVGIYAIRVLRTRVLRDIARTST